MVKLTLPGGPANRLLQGQGPHDPAGPTTGGRVDIRVRALLAILQKNIPGNLAIVSEHMDGGGAALRRRLPLTLLDVRVE